MTALSEREFAALRLLSERPPIGADPQLTAALRALVDHVLHLQAELDELKRHSGPRP